MKQKRNLIRIKYLQIVNIIKIIINGLIVFNIKWLISYYSIISLGLIVRQSCVVTVLQIEIKINNFDKWP